jgi:phage terminase small subunit
LRDLAPEDAAAIKTIVVDTYVEGGGEEAREVKRVRLELHDKRGALAELRRHHEPDRHEHTGKDGRPIETADVTEMSELEVARRIAFLLAKAARATIAGGAEPPAPAAAAEPAAKPEAPNG